MPDPAGQGRRLAIVLNSDFYRLEDRLHSYEIVAGLVLGVL